MTRKEDFAHSHFTMFCHCCTCMPNYLMLRLCLLSYGIWKWIF